MHTNSENPSECIFLFKRKGDTFCWFNESEGYSLVASTFVVSPLVAVVIENEDDLIGLPHEDPSIRNKLQCAHLHLWDDQR